MYLIQSSLPELRSLSRFLDEAFTQFGRHNITFDPVAGVQFRPTADLFEDPQAYYARLEVPGLRKQDLKIEVADQTLNVEGATPSSGDSDTPAESLRFRRSFSLPEGVKSEAITAKLEHGILTLTLPKAEKLLPKSIAVE